MIDFLKNKTVHHREKAKGNTNAFNEILFNRPMTPSTTLLTLPQHTHTQAQCCNPAAVWMFYLSFAYDVPLDQRVGAVRLVPALCLWAILFFWAQQTGDEPIQPHVLLQGLDRPFSSCFNNNQDSRLAKLQLHHETVLNPVLLFLFPLRCKHLSVSAMRAAGLWHCSFCVLFTAAVGLIWRVPPAGCSAEQHPLFPRDIDFISLILSHQCGILCLDQHLGVSRYDKGPSWSQKRGGVTTYQIMRGGNKSSFVLNNHLSRAEGMLFCCLLSSRGWGRVIP